MKFCLLTFLLALTSVTLSQPVITSFSPLSAPVGATVTIKGSKFNAIADSNIVFFGPVRAKVSSATSTSVVVIVPYGATHSNIRLTTKGLTAYSIKKFFSVTGKASVFDAASFENKQDFTSGKYVFSMAVADFDGDGRVDVATGNYSDASITVFRNTANRPGISLNSKIYVSTPPGPGDIKSGDIDGDGKLDLVSANVNDRSVSVYRNTSTAGSLSFAPNQDFPAGTYTVALALGDIDGDGRVDIVETNNQENSVSVLLNKSSGETISFADRVSFPTGIAPAFVEVADMNGDGKQDILVANMYSNSVSLLKNNSTTGNVSFPGSTEVSTGAEPYTLDIGDLNNDNKPDIVTGNLNDSTVSILKNTSSGSAFLFEKQDVVIGTSPGYVTIGELDGDGRPDIVVGGSEINISVLKNTSSGGKLTVSDKQLYYISGSSSVVRVADLDNDAKNDILVGNFDRLTVLRNRLFEPAITSFSPSFGSLGTTVTIHGKNFDSTKTVLFGETPAYSFRVENDSTITATVGDGSSGFITVTDPVASSISAAFFSYVVKTPTITSLTPAEGEIGSVVTIKGKNFGSLPITRYVYFGAVKAPVISANDSILTTVVPLGATYEPVSVTKEGLTAFSSQRFIVTSPQQPGMYSPNSFRNRTDTATMDKPVGLAVGDFDGDGKTDAVVANSGSASISLYRNLSDTGQLLFRRTDVPAGDGPEQVAVADINGDGKLDLAVSNMNSNSVSFFKNVSTPGSLLFVKSPDFATPMKPHSLRFGDLNADGKPDLVIACKSGVWSAFTNVGDTAFVYFALRIDSTISGVPEDVAIADFDDDGKPDVAVSDSLSGIVSIFRNATTTNHQIAFEARQNFAVANSAGLVAADIDKDGRIDLVVSNHTDSKVTVLKNESTSGNFKFKAQNSPAPFPGFYLAVGDLDGDGRPDVVHSNKDSTDISVMINTSAASPGFSIVGQTTVGSRPQSLALADLDGDGKPELITVLNNENKIAILQNEIGKPVKTTLCPGASTVLITNIVGTKYRWQVDAGTGYKNIFDNEQYTGTNSITLQLKNISSSWYGYKCRCVVDGTTSDEYKLVFENKWTGSANGNWEDPANWSCGFIPDENSDVVISSGNVNVHSNLTVRSLRVYPDASVTVSSGFAITVKQ